MTVQAYLNEHPAARHDIQSINAIFESFNICVSEIIKGSQIIRYKLHLPLDIKIQGKLRRAEQDIKYSLTSALKSDDIIYGKSEDYIYIEKKAKDFEIVPFENCIFKIPEKGLYLLLGNDINGDTLFTDLSKAPHILVAGTTGSGKSEMLHTFVASLIFRRKENPCRIIIIDPKRSEFSVYENRNGIDLISEMSEATEKLNWLCDLMESRYETLQHNHCKDISELGDARMYPYVIVIDELADLIQQQKNAEKYIIRLAQKARACGIHLILGTQSPRRDVITGLIKANIPTKIALHTSSQIESRIILDQNGAENLFGTGDMLFLKNGAFKPIRIQSAYISQDIKQKIANGLSYEEHKASNKAPERELTREEYLAKYINHDGMDFDTELRKLGIDPFDTSVNTPAKPKRVGLIKGFFSLLKVKPIMFRTDDYPPKL